MKAQGLLFGTDKRGRRVYTAQQTLTDGSGHIIATGGLFTRAQRARSGQRVFPFCRECRPIVFPVSIAAAEAS